jgi:hypothetical protein
VALIPGPEVPKVPLSLSGHTTSVMSPSRKRFRARSCTTDNRCKLGLQKRAGHLPV